jgi:hypothetical protein
MKRKGFYPPGNSLFKWHLIGFIFFVLLVAYSLVAGITYPGNATVPFGVFRPVIIERLSLVLIVGATLVVHFMIQQSRVFLQARAYREYQSSLNYMADDADDHLRLETQANNTESLDDDFRGEKRKRQC